MLATYATDDMIVLATIEGGEAEVGGLPKQPWRLWVTMVLVRRGGGSWLTGTQTRSSAVYARAFGRTRPSPLARGILAGAYQGGFSGGSTARSKGRDRTRTESLYRGEAVFDIAGRVMETADKYGRSPARIALAWLLSKPGVTAPVVGISRLGQLDELVAATEIQLEREDVTFLEELYRPVENLLSIGSS